MNRDPLVLKDVASIHKVFESQVDVRKDQVAIKQRDHEMSYNELNSRSNFLANHLQSIGVKHADVVAVEMSHSAKFVISILAILKCGATYFPIDKSVPIKRNQIYLQAANASLIIARSEVNQYHIDGLNVLAMSEDSLFNSSLTEFNSYPTSPDDSAYVMFTSGSTGNPKGVLVPHRAVTRLVLQTNYIQINASDRILQFAPPSFDASTFEFWGALLNGAVLVPYSGIGLDPNLLKADIEDNNVTILWLTAALFHLITDKYIEALSPLRVLLAGGDVLNPKYINKILNSFPDMTLINGYGPTENTTFTCCHVMTKDSLPLKSVPIGKAITGTEIHILDDVMQPVEQGQVGELFASGSGVALGYMNDMTSKACFFRNNQIAPGLIYRTGDLVMENKHGEIEFIGRKDNQVKIRGYRVSLEELRTSIVVLNDITDALVVTKKFESGDQLLIAHVQVENGFDNDVKRLKKELANSLPAYMIPDKFEFNTILPINCNGKIDIKLMLANLASEE